MVVFYPSKYWSMAAMSCSRTASTVPSGICPPAVAAVSAAAELFHNELHVDLAERARRDDHTPVSVLARATNDASHAAQTFSSSSAALAAVTRSMSCSTAGDGNVVVIQLRAGG